MCVAVSYCTGKRGEPVLILRILDSFGFLLGDLSIKQCVGEVCVLGSVECSCGVEVCVLFEGRV